MSNGSRTAKVATLDSPTLRSLDMDDSASTNVCDPRLSMEQLDEALETKDLEQSFDAKAGDGVVWVEWTRDDAENPFNWSRRRKWQTTLICCAFTVSVAFSNTAFSSGSPSMMRELGCSHELAALGLAIFPLGFALGPLTLAPLSEAYGRYPMYIASAVLYLLMFIPIALARSIETVLIARFISGVAASTGGTLVGGTVADLFDAADRGLPMSLYSFCAFGANGLGPALCGWVEMKKGWRWIEWYQMMVAGAIAIVLVLFTRETRASVLLSRRAKKLRDDLQDDRYQCRSDAERSSISVLMRVSMTRPLYLLGTEAIVASFSLWAAFSYGSAFLLIEAVPLIFKNNVRGSLQTSALSRALTSGVAATIGFIGNIYQEKLYRENVARRGPEARLYSSLIGGLLFPAGAFILAFSQDRGHWMGPIVGLTLIFLGIYTIYLAVFSYLADCYTIYASSALSGQSLCRNLGAFAMPLFTTQMYDALGYQWSSFLAGMIALVLAATPWVLFRFGPAIRARS
ncbi:hypothetical protein BMF94_6938 [Rhodotorula taiwanensis]|uniref:Major facilitator superfamily (MFS) profile domain-containing protein n=1 Tax=Rhodotorula taiwanensis TaxID=741276 RepID=A0A2S5B062_9BASI|nr:hypothetical protein BMF94_6938 [Rhodotorula taiwanensis]